MWYPGFVVCSVLRMELYCSIGLGHSNFTVIVREDSELDDFVIKPSETFQTKLSGIEYFDLGSIYSCYYNVSLIV